MISIRLDRNTWWIELLMLNSNTWHNLTVSKQMSYVSVIVFNWNHFEMRLLNLRINFYLLRTFCPHLGSFCVVSSFTTFRPNFTSGLLRVILLRPRIGMLSLVTVSPVITAFHSCCRSHHVFDQVNLWPAWVAFETAIFWYCSGSRLALSEDSGFKSYSSRPEVYLVKNVVRSTTTMEGSNYWGYGYKSQHSYPRLW